jgi:Tol biopolymer transport system component
MESGGKVMKTGFLLILTVTLLAGQPVWAAAQSTEAGKLLQRAIQKESVDGDAKAALDLYKKALSAAKNDRAVAAEALVRMGQCHEKLGSAEARAAYERVLRDYPDQADKVQIARQRLNALDSSRAIGPVARRLASGIYVRAVSPDERCFVYLDGNGNFRLRDLRTEKDTKITDDTLGAGWTFGYAPVAISSDSKYLAYTRDAKDANELRVSALDGSGMRVLHRSTNKAVFVFVSAWTPDGKKLIVLETSDSGFNWRRGLLDVGDGSMKYVGQPPLRGFKRWGLPSPDGRFIAYDVPESEGPQSSSFDVFLYDTVADRDTPVLSGPTNDAVLGWSSTGLLFIRSGASKRDVWSVTIENGKPKGEPQLIRSDLGNGEPLLLGRSGVLYQLLYKEQLSSFIADFDIPTGKVSLPGQSVNARQVAYGPRWSPDGLFFYYLTEDNLGTIVIRSERSGVERKLTVDLAPEFVQWLAPSPDGRSLAVTAADKDLNYGVYLIDLASGSARQIIDISNKNRPVTVCQNWSPDGKAMYYKYRDKEAPDVFVVMRRNLETGEERQVYRGGIHTRELALSPDGTRLAFYDRWPATGKSLVLMSMDEASGEIRELDRPPEGVGIRLPIWSADGRRVFYCKEGKEGWELWWAPADGGKPERLASFSGSILAMAMHPKGNKIAYTAKSTVKELWALENLFSK